MRADQVELTEVIFEGLFIWTPEEHDFDVGALGVSGASPKGEAFSISEGSIGLGVESDEVEDFAEISWDGDDEELLVDMEAGDFLFGLPGDNNIEQRFCPKLDVFFIFSCKEEELDAIEGQADFFGVDHNRFIIVEQSDEVHFGESEAQEVGISFGLKASVEFEHYCRKIVSSPTTS